MEYVGITESGEVAFNLDIFEHLYKANIIITKRLTNKLIEKLIENKDKCILHLTCTGFGGTVLEPFVPDYNKTYCYLKDLLEKGFPIEQVVLRVDPCIPTEKGIKLACDVINKFSDLGIKRVRISSLDMYKHVKERFKEKDIKIPYDTFHADIYDRMSLYNTIKKIGEEKGFDVEVCGEPGIDSISCLSQKDIDILGLNDVIKLEGNKGQRSSCHCPANKKELIKGKPNRCEHECLYCFWKN